jgi:predicted nuclease with TOPRIM domain
MTEKNKSGLKVAKGANNAQEQKTVKATEKPTFEQLQKENEELKKQVSAIPSDLETRINYFNHKKELIKRLSLLEENRSELNRHLDNISELSAENDFNNNRYKITVVDGDSSYNSRDIFSIQNPVVIGDVITFILGRIEAKQA